ncbi:MAG: glycosyltransferase family 4 protein, partial [Patescibacteria group bacterium]|nr:glycosyltransferase family 4 protein [Patescibacteria group bacterium]
GVGEDLMDETHLHFAKTILFMGNYDWMQNIEAARCLAQEVFPLILQKVPNARLVIAGQHTEKIQNLKAVNIELLDLKIEDTKGVKRAYREYGVLVAPLYGPGGTRLKILGAMAARMPVVTTDIGIEGIEAENNSSVLFDKTPQQLAQLTIKILEDRELYDKIANNARKLVEEKYTYQAIADKLDAIYNEVQKPTNT